MADDQTETTKRPGENGETNPSAVASVSVRAWLAILITVTICGNWTANMVMAAMGLTSVNITIPEPLYSAFTMVLGIYFGQAIKK